MKIKVICISIDEHEFYRVKLLDFKKRSAIDKLVKSFNEREQKRLNVLFHVRRLRGEKLDIVSCMADFNQVIQQLSFDKKTGVNYLDACF